MPNIDKTDAGNTNIAYAAATGKKTTFPGTRRRDGAIAFP